MSEEERKAIPILGGMKVNKWTQPGSEEQNLLEAAAKVVDLRPAAKNDDLPF